MDAVLAKYSFGFSYQKIFKENTSISWGKDIHLYFMDHFCMSKMTGTDAEQSLEESVIRITYN